MSASALEWNARRATMSHDLLKNRIIPAVFKLRKVLSGEVEDLSFLSQFRESTTLEIERLCAEGTILADDAEYFLSPRRYFEVGPLLGLDDETKEWLPAALHAIWLERVQLRDRVRLMKSCVGDLREACSWWRRRDGLVEDVPMLENAASLLTKLRGFAGVLSDLSRLPPYRLLP